MPILTKLRSAMRRSTESSVEESKRIKDILALPDIPRNIPRMVSALRQLELLCMVNASDIATMTLDNASDPATASSKTSASVTATERRSMELAASLADDSLNISNITDGIVRALLSHHLEISNAALDLVERLAEAQQERFIAQLPDYSPALVVLFDCLPENEQDARAIRAVHLMTKVIQEMKIATVLPDVGKALKSSQTDTQLTAAELLAEAAEKFEADVLGEYVLILCEAITHCATAKDAAMQRCAVRIYLPLIKIGNADIQRYQMDMPREVQRNLSIGLRVMLSERKQTDGSGGRPGRSLRSRASTSVMPRLHQALQEEEEEEEEEEARGATALAVKSNSQHHSDTMRSTASTVTASNGSVVQSRRRTHTGFGTLRSVRSRLSLSTTNTAIDEDAAPDERPTSPQISVEFGSTDSFADDAFSELSRFMRADNTSPQSPSDSTVAGDKWDIRSAPEMPEHPPTADAPPRPLKRAVSHERLVERGMTASIRASARRIRQQIWVSGMAHRRWSKALIMHG
ncbi:hypothetical protein SYNPS1DRAFT_27114 [Syncephalis pseudoplumigaleata]|uniref:Clasp N terminal-domain-containing protein n=1 Tax=Syncephalis pseudoplumigaleata TaxID=1712513 RepID=A0A4P9Z3U5_9FUNG|nr:hypothetical protein SYNPS1DRAFT_27114 [Syncephalis pseudoplumigaleata]|eukprot:RKP27224.1 hypothetical protein SYNPS1DRAFT_27114 [Syncephalis pseudoplumigaleata]